MVRTLRPGASPINIIRADTAPFIDRKTTIKALGDATSRQPELFVVLVCMFAEAQLLAKFTKPSAPLHPLRQFEDG